MSQRSKQGWRRIGEADRRSSCGSFAQHGYRARLQSGLICVGFILMSSILMSSPHYVVTSLAHVCIGMIQADEFLQRFDLALLPLDLRLLLLDCVD